MAPVRPTAHDIMMSCFCSGIWCDSTATYAVLTVLNLGSGTAGPTITRVDFGRYGSVSMPTTPLAADASTDLALSIGETPNTHRRGGTYAVRRHAGA